MVFPRRSFLLSLTAFFSARSVPALDDPWTPDALIEPEAFAGRLKASSSKPRILYVGFPILYKGAHIAGAVVAGPCNKPEGLAQLRKVASRLDRKSEVILYCGCCPMDHCPNIRPAYRALSELGFSSIKVLHLPTNLHTDWTSKGYPTESSQS
jgi:thiosulfate/3-mercaptopyruvate sulfurtransferase